MLRWLTILFIATLTACAGSSTPSTATNQPAQPTDTQSQSPDAFPTPPEGARFTLRVTVFTDPEHVAQATRMKDLLVRQTQSNEWYVVHQTDESDLYYGFYKTFDDRTQVAEYTRAQGDRAKISSMVDTDGDPLFPYVGFCAIDSPDPPAPKEYDLSQNPGYWTLQIGVYKGSPDRKKFAVDAVKAARSQGIEAWYRHGPATSEVYIGSWPREAVQEQDSAAAESDDPNQPLLVVPGPLPNGVDPDKVYDQSGRKMKVVMPKLVILDPSLKAMTERYPNYSVNGEVVGHKVQAKDGSVQTIPWPTYLVQVPHDNDQNQQDKNDLGNNNPAAGPGDTGTDTPAVPGLTGLRQ